MSIATCEFNGRCGNELYQRAHLIAYAKRYGMDYYFPTTSKHTPGLRPYLSIQGTSLVPPIGPVLYREPSDGKGPYYHDIPLLNNPKFEGYWQSFKYIDDYRDDILSIFNIPFNFIKGLVSIHCRRGDYCLYPQDFPPLSLEYYQKAVAHFNSLGYYQFMVFSDDILWCKKQFTGDNFHSDCIFGFSEGRSELEDISYMSSMEHNITANSSFSFMAAWLNKNPDKVVLCPSYNHMFKGINRDMIPPTWVQINY